MSSANTQDFLQFFEPSTATLLTIGAFLLLLPTSSYVAQAAFNAAPLGPLVIGLVFGVPISNWLELSLQHALGSLGYCGLLLLVFHGGLASDLQQAKHGLATAFMVACTGILLPIAFSFLLLWKGFGYSTLQAFMAGAACASTSLGTTFALLKASSLDVTRLGAVLTTAAMADDVVSLVLLRVVESIASPDAWSIAQPIVVAISLLLVAWFMTRFALIPLTGRFEPSFKKYPLLLLLVLAIVPFGFIAAAGYAGTSVLLGAFVAGIVCSALPVSKELEQVYQLRVGSIEDYLLVPLFFASIGFSIPIRRMFDGKIVWRGIVYALLMALGKVFCGAWVGVKTDSLHPSFAIPMETVSNGPASEPPSTPAPPSPAQAKASQTTNTTPALLLGFSMVARGEIGLLISQVAFSAPLIPLDLFLITTWAILVCTLVGPIAVGIVIRKRVKGRELPSTLGTWA